eukprot:scaffold11588_cov30-Phaeocystis_antarctica.AAC.1
MHSIHIFLRCLVGAAFRGPHRLRRLAGSVVGASAGSDRAQRGHVPPGRSATWGPDTSAGARQR